MLDLLIVSFGGTGCSYFNYYLRQHTGLKINDLYDFDQMKHMPLNPGTAARFNGARKTIFLINDPLLAVESHFRRGWGVYQSEKLGNPHQLSRNMKHGEYVNEVLKQKRDIFGIEYQFDSIVNHKDLLQGPLLILDFRKIKQSIETLSEFLQLDKKVFGQLNVQKRKSSEKKLPKTYVEIYKNLDKKMSKYHGTILKPKTPAPAPAPAPAPQTEPPKQAQRQGSAPKIVQPVRPLIVSSQTKPAVPVNKSILSINGQSKFLVKMLNPAKCSSSNGEPQPLKEVIIENKPKLRTFLIGNMINSQK
jgi:hypothetical protein